MKTSNMEVINNHFFHHYQPIFDIQDFGILGYEALFRSNNRSNPEAIFATAKKNQKLYELDSRSIYKAFQTFIKECDLNIDIHLFINVFPSTIMNPLFNNLIQKIIHESVIESQQIIFEINENELCNLNEVKRSMFQLKDFGFQIAIDDYGKGASNLQSIIELKPDYIKLDNYFMENISHSKLKQEILYDLLQFCSKFDIELIVEGIEDKLSLAFIKTLGVHYAQGFLLGKPTILPKSKKEGFLN